MPTVISIINHKGGVGKTTSAVNIAAGLGELGEKVLLIDVDPQGSASLSLGVRSEGEELLHALRTTGPLPVTPSVAPGVDLVPSGPTFAEARHRFSGEVGRELMKRCMARTEGDWQWVIFDCPPTLEILTQNALRASRYVVIPVEAHFLGLSGLQHMLAMIEAEKAHHPGLEISAVIPCRAHPRRRVHQQIMAELECLFPGHVSPIVRENVALTEAPGAGKPVFQYAPRSHGTEDYRAVTDWLYLHITGKPAPARPGVA